MKKISNTFLLLTFCCTFVHAQQFVDITTEQNIIHQYYGPEYGGGASFADWDKDGWDDLTLSQVGQYIKFYHNEGGTFVLVPPFVTTMEMVKSIVWIDYDNDDDRDIFISSFDGPVKLYQNDGNFNFTDVTTAAGFLATENRTYANNWGDPNADGWPDVYISNYNGWGFGDPTATNQFYLNNGDGTFTEMAVEVGIDNGSCYTFEGLWLDYDRDGDQDLCVINDRYECQNYLYRNDGNLQFTDVSEESGIGGYFIFAMNCSAEDYDNDKDLDIYITNSPFGNLFHVNNGNGTFSEMAVYAGLTVNDHCWAAQWMDIDNDGFVDLHVTSSPYWTGVGQDRIFRNDGTGTFEDMTDAWGLTGDFGWSHSTAQGDYNNDGTMDLVVVNDSPDYTKLWEVESNGNSWLKVTPEGTISNRDGIGTLIECYAGGHYYSRYTYCGEGYLNQNSFSEIFGLSQTNMVDTLTLTWLSGVVDTWHNIPVNQFLVLEEGSSLNPEITYEGDPIFCPGDSIVLNGGDYNAWLWNTGHTGQYLTVTEAGEYYVTVFSEQGFSFISGVLDVDTYENPVGVTMPEHISCFGFDDGSIELTNASGTGIVSVLWSNNAQETILVELEAGEYNYQFTDLNGCGATGSEVIEEPCELAGNCIISDSIACTGETATIVHEIICGTPPYNISIPGNEWNAGEYQVEVIDNNGCAITYSVIITQPDSLQVQLEVNDALCFDETGNAVALPAGGTIPYSFNWSNGDDDAEAENLPAGFYSLGLSDSNGCFWSDNFQIAQPQDLIVEIEITPTDSTYEISASPSGGIEPYSYLWSTGETSAAINTDQEQFPVVLLTVTDANNCTTDVEIPLAVQESGSGELKVFPNPASTVLNVFAAGNGVIQTARILDLTGNIVWGKGRIQSNFLSIDVSQFSQGTYTIEILDSRGTLSRKKFLKH